MVASQPPGKSSSANSTASDVSLARLVAIAESASVQTIFKALGPTADLYLVGGTVRDALDLRENIDIDLATRLTPDKAREKLTAKGLRVIDTGILHGTVTVLVEKDPVELTTFRKAGPRNIMAFSDSINEDLQGRDFTINAIAFAVSDLSLLDPLSGLNDLQSNTLRSVGSAAERFEEDPQRILRMIRFGPAQGRAVDSDLLKAARSQASLLKNVSVERIRTELDRILMAPHPAAGLRVLAELGLLPYTLPELIDSVGFEQNDFHTQDVFEHTLTVVERCPPELMLRWAALFHDIGKPHTLSIGDDGRRHFFKHEIVGADMALKAMERLRFSNQEMQDISTIVSLHMRPLDCGPTGVRRLMRELGSLRETWMKFKVADMTPKGDPSQFERDVISFNDLVSIEEKRETGSVYSKLAVNGDDLIVLGLMPGKRIGEVLKQLHEEVLENPDLNEKNILLERARLMIQQAI